MTTTDTENQVAKASVGPAKSMKAGSKVRVKGLINKSEYNGKIGTLIKFNAEKGRWGVDMGEGNGSLLVKPEHLDVEIDGKFPELSGYEQYHQANAKPCAWSTESAAHRWAQRLNSNDPKFKSLCILRPFPEQDQRILFEALENTTVLEELFINRKALCDAGLKCLNKALLKNKSLKLIQMGGEWFTDRELEMICSGIQASVLERIDFGLSAFEGAGLTSLARALQNRVTKAVETDDNQHVSVLKSLNLRDSITSEGVKSDADREGIRMLCELLPNCACEKIDLSGIELTAEDARNLGKWVGSDHAKEVVLQNCGLDNSRLGELLHSGIAPGLEVLRLDENSFGDSSDSGDVNGDSDCGFEILWRELRNASSLTELSLTKCDIVHPRKLLEAICADGFAAGGDGAFVNLRDNKFGNVVNECFDMMVGENKRLPRGLDLSNCGLNSANTMGSLRHSKDLKQLVLQANDGAGLRSFCQLPAEEIGFASLQELDLANNSLSEDDTYTIVKSLLDDRNRFPSLQVLVLGGNDIDSARMGVCEECTETRGLRVIWEQN